ncbi:FmdB family zinc ribbon protein [Rhodohalobacter mucosus]|uniref:FmdB family transcriptional regulator n=1 Tax=Rhodohalobacter mucosus TaxID=2079485 RepID=A0A316TY73_9BACT|nr:FmdB family zinc ribbon protein [Rhodohalobacter mucosus]PWN07772.1 FmdB family transcriptional regulator [Rhodohalobacter mucosus]
MPTYEYKREDGTVFEFIQGMNDKPLTTCPDTGQPVKRIISGGGGVVYKGTGWYVTDYKNGSRPAGKDDSKPDTSGSTGSAAKSDKPDTPPAE